MRPKVTSGSSCVSLLRTDNVYVFTLMVFNSATAFSEVVEEGILTVLNPKPEGREV